MIGTKLAHYEITSHLGSGGMGDVYQATDSKLGRSVAIKFLPEAFSHDSERAARFEREARVLASLNHPHIAGIHGLEESGERKFLVMELVEGETLAERIKRGPIPAEEAFRIAHQIADALEAAHEKGVIHRDLKPANVKVTPEGKVKVLDFGLAKAMEEAPPAANSNSPTLSALATNAGIILGTAGYMSPEQARGHVADQRSDIFSFGCVLYEMLTGRQPFPGETVTDIIASVVARDPDWRAIPSNLHPKVEELIRRCLAKNRKDRYHAIADVRVELEAILADPHGLRLQAAHPIDPRPLWRRATPFAVTAALAAAIAVVIMWMTMRTGPSPSAILTRFSFALPDTQVFTNPTRNVIAISPDGANMVYVANQQLYLKTMGEMQVHPIPGTTQNPFGPFFSPDGRWVAFGVFSERKLKKIAVTGGAAVTISDLSGIDDVAKFFLGASWGPDDQILIGGPGAILRVSANGGRPEKLITLKNGEAAQGPQVLPGGDALLFTLGTSSSSGAAWDKAQIVVQSLKSGERKILIEGGSDARYVPTGHIVYALGTTLLAVPFDVSNLQVTGGPVPVIEGVRRASSGVVGGGATAYYGFSSNGSMVYIPGPPALGTQALTVTLVDRAGAGRPLGVPAGLYNAPRVSPNGQQLALWTDDGNESNVWVYGLSGTVPMRRLTFGGRNDRSIWTRDGQHIAFTSDREGGDVLFWQLADGSGSAERLFKPEQAMRLQSESWLPDGKTLIFFVSGGAIWIVSPGSGQKPKPLIVPAGNPNLSLDGRWLAYQATESGRNEVYVQPFPITGAKYQVSTGGGDNPLWSPDGKQLFYLRGTGSVRQILTVDIQTQPSFVVGKTTPLPIQGIVQTGMRDYDITPDGRYFVVLFPSSQNSSEKPPPEQINVTLNWFRELQERVPVK